MPLEAVICTVRSIEDGKERVGTVTVTTATTIFIKSREITGCLTNVSTGMTLECALDIILSVFVKKAIDYRSL